MRVVAGIVGKIQILKDSRLAPYDFLVGRKEIKENSEKHKIEADYCMKEEYSRFEEASKNSGKDTYKPKEENISRISKRGISNIRALIMKNPDFKMCESFLNTIIHYIKEDENGSKKKA